MTRIWNYATDTNENGVGTNIPDKGKTWIDKHLCPYYLWSSSSRLEAGKFCRYNCTVDSMEHIAIAAVDTYGFAEENEDWETNPSDPEFKGTYEGATIGNGSTYYMLMDKFFSALSVRMNHTGILWTPPGVFNPTPILLAFPADNYVLTKAPTDYVTIDYHDGENGPVTGSLKIVVLDESVSTDNAYNSIFADNGGFTPYGLLLHPQWNDREVYYTITQTNTCEYPVVWGCALCKTSNAGDAVVSRSKSVWGCETPESRKVVRYTKMFYDNLKKAMPGLMSYRYQNEIFNEYTNAKGKSLTDYGDAENTVVAKAIPIMDVSGLKDLFTSSFGGGNFEAGKQFTYSHCVVDLNPELANYNKPGETHGEFNVQETQFPMSFANGVNVNVDYYKTSKMVLTRVDKISGEKFDTFTMGSHATDYDLITDPKKRKYKDDESIVDGAVDDYATVTLGNGGSYQKRYVDNDLKGDDVHPDGYNQDGDLYYADTKNPTPNDKRQVAKRDPQTGKKIENKYDAKYFRNKHFFLDPFALTIAQWCYVYGMHRNEDGSVPTKLDDQGKTVFDGDAMRENARRNLAKDRGVHPGSIGLDNFNQMQESYWRYVCVWGEPGEWEHWKSKPIPHAVDSDEDDIVEMRDIEETATTPTTRPTESSAGNIGVAPTEEDEEKINDLCHRTDWYDPLLDTRPFYCATYDDVRGTGKTHQAPHPGGGQYVIDGDDEYQLRDGASDSNISFMDVLNNKVVFQTQKRVYGNFEPPETEAVENEGLVKYFEQ